MGMVGFIDLQLRKKVRNKNKFSATEEAVSKVEIAWAEHEK
jgi:hypothetical protein